MKVEAAIEASQWFHNGDHPEDGSEPMTVDRATFLTEGKVVRRYRTPELDGRRECEHCGLLMHDHGWVETLEGGHVVCPGDWIIKGVKGEFYVDQPSIKDTIFRETYEPVEGD